MPKKHFHSASICVTSSIRHPNIWYKNRKCTQNFKKITYSGNFFFFFNLKDNQKWFYLSHKLVGTSNMFNLSNLRCEILCMSKESLQFGTVMKFKKSIFWYIAQFYLLMLMFLRAIVRENWGFRGKWGSTEFDQTCIICCITTPNLNPKRIF